MPAKCVSGHLTTHSTSVLRGSLRAFASSVPVRQRLELDARRDLNDTGPQIPSYLTKRTGIIQPPGRRVEGPAVVDSSERRVVERVGHISPQLGANPLPNDNILHEREIPVIHAGIVERSVPLKIGRVTLFAAP